MIKCFLIVDVAAFYQSVSGYSILPEQKRPSYVFYEKWLAQQELLRLQKEIPGGEFILFEAKEFARPNQMDQNVYKIENIIE